MRTNRRERLTVSEKCVRAVGRGARPISEFVKGFVRTLLGLIPILLLAFSCFTISFGVWSHTSFARDIDYRCNGPFTAGRLCRNGTGGANCQGQPDGFGNADATDNLDITNVGVGTEITITVTRSAVVSTDPTFDAELNGQNGTMLTPNDPVDLTVSSGGPVSTSYTHTVVAGDPPEANFQLMLETGSNGDGRKAASYTISCRQPMSTITIKKTVVDGAGGDFAFDSNVNALDGANANYNVGTTTVSSTMVTAPFSAITVEETINSPDYALTSASCELAGGGVPTNGSGTLTNNELSFTPAANEEIVCTFTNTVRQASIEIRKNVVGGPGGDFEFDSNVNPLDAGNATYNVGTTSVSSTTVSAPFNAITVEETINTGTYALTSATCQLAGGGVPSNGAGTLNNTELTFTPAIDESVICTFTNTFQPPQGQASIEIRKTVIDGPGGDFSFDSNENALDAATATYNVGTTVVSATALIAPFAAVTIEETIDSGAYQLTAASCELAGGGAPANGSGTLTNSELSITPSAGENIICTFTNRRLQQRGSLTIRKVVNGADKNFSFSGTTPFGNFTLSNGQTITKSNLLPGNFIITETSDPDYSLNSVTCNGNSNPPVINLNAGTLTIFVAAADDVTCTFRNGQVRDPRMREVSRLFIHRRVDNLLTHGPDRARILRRLQSQDPPACGLKDDCSSEPPPPLKLGAAEPGALGGTSSGSARIGGVGSTGMPNYGNPAFGNRTLSSEPFGEPYSGGLFANEQDDQPWDRRGSSTSPLLSSIVGQLQGAASGGQSFKFGTSLSELRESAKSAQDKDEQKKMKEGGLDYNGQMYQMPKNALHQRLDIWVEGQYSGYNDSTGGLRRDGNFRVLYVGADYSVAPGILVGALVQVDDTREDIDDPTLLGEVEGTGWMAGPYLGIRLTDTLYFDARAAWGTSNNDIWLQDAATGWRSGQFDTERWLANANLTGNYQFGSWRLSPQIGVAYGSESYDTYFNSLGLAVDGGKARIGRATGGAEVGYQLRHNDGSVLEPHIGIKGIWNFQTDDLVVNGVVVDTEVSRAQVEGGLLYRTPSGFAVRGALAYDGIGADEFESYTGQFWVNIPLN